MKEQKLMEMLGEVSPELIEKYALPDYKAVTAPGHSARNIVRSDSKSADSKAEPEKKRPFYLRYSVAAAIAGVCLIANVALIYGIGRMNRQPVETSAGISVSHDITELTPQDFEMPDLVGMTYTEAVRAYGDRLDITVRYGADADTAAGVIYKQSIAPGETVHTGDAVTLDVSAEGLTLEDYSGYDYAELEALFTRHAILIDRKDVYDANVEAGRVISTDPGAGTDIAPGETVAVSVSLGEMPEDLAVTDGTAENVITTVDLMLTTAAETTSTTAAATVETKEPMLGPPDGYQMIPNFVETDFYEVCALAEKLGLTVCAHEADYPDADAFINGDWGTRSMLVMSQVQNAGSIVPLGSRVDVTVPMMPLNEDVSYTVKDVTPTGAVLVVTNASKVQWGHWSLPFHISKTVDPELPNQGLELLDTDASYEYWEAYEKTIPAGEDFKNELAPGESAEYQLDWTRFYGALPSGEYFLTITTDYLLRAGAQEVAFNVP